MSNIIPYLNHLDSFFFLHKSNKMVLRIPNPIETEMPAIMPNPRSKINHEIDKKKSLLPSFDLVGKEESGNCKKQKNCYF